MICSTAASGVMAEVSTTATGANEDMTTFLRLVRDVN